MPVCTAGDVITGINGRKVTKAADLAIALDDFKVGDKVSLRVRRGEEGSQVSNPPQHHAASLVCWQGSMRHTCCQRCNWWMLMMQGLTWLSNGGCHAARPCVHAFLIAKFMLMMRVC